MEGLERAWRLAFTLGVLLLIYVLLKGWNWRKVGCWLRGGHDWGGRHGICCDRCGTWR